MQALGSNGHPGLTSWHAGHGDQALCAKSNCVHDEIPFCGMAIPLRITIRRSSRYESTARDGSDSFPHEQKQMAAAVEKNRYVAA
jgi:hypothetical protein